MHWCRPRPLKAVLSCNTRHRSREHPARCADDSSGGTAAAPRFHSSSQPCSTFSESCSCIFDAAGMSKREVQNKIAVAVFALVMIGIIGVVIYFVVKKKQEEAAA